MKQEFISLSPAAVFAVFAIGYSVRSIISASDAILFVGLLIFLLGLALLVRADAREDIKTGTYRRGWLVRRWEGPLS
ncbi:MAG: hypothetical protein V4673_14405 [Pseudomonadota bacterium]